MLKCNNKNGLDEYNKDVVKLQMQFWSVKEKSNIQKGYCFDSFEVVEIILFAWK